MVATMPLLVRVPGEADFPDDDDFLDDPALDALLLDVVGSYEALRAIEDHGIGVRALWKKKGGKSKGALTYAKCVKPTGLLAHFCRGVDFVIWLAADNVELESWTTVQIRKLLYHEARHIGWDEGDDEHDPKAVLKAHDLEIFLGELSDTGAWERRRDAVAAETLRPDFAARSQDR
jgi:hypothetical protein